MNCTSWKEMTAYEKKPWIIVTKYNKMSNYVLYGQWPTVEWQQTSRKCSYSPEHFQLISVSYVGEQHMPTHTHIHTSRAAVPQTLEEPDRGISHLIQAAHELHDMIKTNKLYSDTAVWQCEQESVVIHIISFFFVLIPQGVSIYSSILLPFRLGQNYLVYVLDLFCSRGQS